LVLWGPSPRGSQPTQVTHKTLSVCMYICIYLPLHAASSHIVFITITSLSLISIPAIIIIVVTPELKSRWGHDCLTWLVSSPFITGLLGKENLSWLWTILLKLFHLAIGFVDYNFNYWIFVWTCEIMKQFKW